MTTLYQLQLDQRDIDCGMSYVIQLESGHFFLVDGGYFTPGEADRLYEFLRARCIGAPVVAGWYFSHAHQDHIGVFLDMMECHGADIELCGLYFNFQPVDLPETSEGWRTKCNDLATVRRFYEVLEERCAGVPVHTLRTGERLRVEELSLEVLYTHEDLDVASTFNDHSTVAMLMACGQRILLLGDVFTEGSRILLQRPEKLRCDIVQVSHHGYGGATRALYEATGARVALWPTPDYGVEPNIRRPANHYLLKESSVVEQIVSGRGTARLVLPYAPRAKDDRAGS